jgi:adiponectin receptor
METTGIVVLIVGSYYPAMYYLFWEHMGTYYFYLFCITFLGSLALYSIWSSAMHHPGMETIRLALFLGLGLFGTIPLPHAVVRLFPFPRTSRSSPIFTMLTRLEILKNSG